MDERGQFADAAPLLAKNFLGMCCADDYDSFRTGEYWERGRIRGRTDVSHRRRNANLDTRVSFLCQLALEELVQFGVEDAVGDKFPTLGNRGSWYRSHNGGACFVIWGWSSNADGVYGELLVGVTVVEDPRLGAKRLELR